MGHFASENANNKEVSTNPPSLHNSILATSHNLISHLETHFCEYSLTTGVVIGLAKNCGKYDGVGYRIWNRKNLCMYKIRWKQSVSKIILNSIHSALRLLNNRTLYILLGNVILRRFQINFLTTIFQYPDRVSPPVTLRLTEKCKKNSRCRCKRRLDTLLGDFWGSQ